MDAFHTKLQDVAMNFPEIQQTLGPCTEMIKGTHPLEIFFEHGHCTYYVVTIIACS